ncbi:hypothetical protein J6590_095739 [Homalodisca vitripennis]|nr:hypothetical protein J6590_095739 [Homalodisca vitripennis]
MPIKRYNDSRLEQSEDEDGDRKLPVKLPLYEPCYLAVPSVGLSRHPLETMRKAVPKISQWGVSGYESYTPANSLRNRNKKRREIKHSLFLYVLIPSPTDEKDRF